MAAADRFRRKLTETELRSCCDFAAMDAAWTDARDRLLTDWTGVVAAQREQIRRQVTAAVDTNDPDRLAALEVDTDTGAALLETALLRFAQAAGEAMEREARAQGVRVGPWSLPEDEADALTAAAGRELLRAAARTASRILGLNLVNSAARRAVQLIGIGRSGREVANQVDTHLRSLTDAQPRETIGAALTQAQNEGRRAVLAVAPAATYTASEILDRNTCAPCRAVDGTVYATLAEASNAYPAGNYVRCLGSTRCRGTFVAVWDAAETVTAAAVEESAMPYEIVSDHPDCPEGRRYAVVKRGTGERVGCHDSETSAADQVQALYAAEEDDDMDETYLTASVEAADGTAPWEGVLAVEGVTTGDGREFAPDALTWADLPVPLRWNKEDSHGGEPTTVAVNVGRIDKIWRDGSKIMGSGVLDLSTDDGRTAYNKIQGQFLRGVSIDADSIGDADMEFVWPADMEQAAEDDPMAALFARPEKVIFTKGRIRAATLVDIPAFSEAYVSLSPMAVAAAALVSRVAFGAVGVHHTATSDASWDGPANESQLPSPVPESRARAAYAWIDTSRSEDGALPKDACRFIHHEVNADGTVGPANLQACSSGIGMLNGGRGGTTIPASDRRGVYNHLAGHLRDAGREVPEATFSDPAVVTASLALWTPPATWFSDPQLTAPTPITVTADGRLFGHAARWGECHIGQSGVCVSPPQESTHPYFLTGELTTDVGDVVSVGQITVGTSHAPLHLGHRPAAQHYDHTGWAVADVTVGNDHFGIWVAGAIRPGADPAKVHELRAAGQVSGDWRRIGGQLRLVGLLAVNVPGFPVPKLAARLTSGKQVALVAAGLPQPTAPAVTEAELDTMALRRVMSMLATKVRGEVK